jgi:hypothetical protein
MHYWHMLKEAAYVKKLYIRPLFAFLVKCFILNRIDMVDVAQLVEHQVVALGVVGSSPTIHPNLARIKKKRTLLMSLSGRGAIGSALALGARGCQFESGRPDHVIFLQQSSNQNLALCKNKNI